MIRMTINKDNPRLEELMSFLGYAEKRVLPNTEEAIKKAALAIQSAWVQIATEVSRSDGYAKSIQKEQTGTYAHEIFSEAKIAEIMENGSPRLDMKTTHPYGPRSRMSKKGIPYLIVPFQWGTEKNAVKVGPKNIVPKQLLNLMRSKRFKQSTVKNETYLSPNAAKKQELVERYTYTWGSRAKGSDFDGTVEQKTYADGMVRFEQSEKKGKRYGGYFTFRVISAESPANSWIKPEMPARHITRRVAGETREGINAIVEAGLIKDFTS